MTDPKEPESKDDDDDDDFVPLVVVAKLADVANWIPEGLGKKFGGLACWFLLEDDAELVELFERAREDPASKMSKAQVAAILGGLRDFATERADELQTVLGPSDSIGLGFHADAPLAKVVASFEDDGFAVVGRIEDGHVIEDDEDDEDEDGDAGES
jgi:hypothetical protein